MKRTVSGREPLPLRPGRALSLRRNVRTSAPATVFLDEACDRFLEHPGTVKSSNLDKPRLKGPAPPHGPTTTFIRPYDLAETVDQHGSFHAPTTSKRNTNGARII